MAAHFPDEDVEQKM